VTAADGREHAEVFIVDLPADLTVAGDAPLQGTATRRPAPPRGVTQRRLTFTADRPFRGVALAPRHWVRASPDGRQLAFLMKDDAGVVQLWTIAPAGGKPRQLSRGSSGITSSFTWSPDGRSIAHTMDGSVCITEAETGTTRRLTPRQPESGPEALACVFSPDGRMIAFTRPVTTPEGTFSQIFTVTTEAP
jgi:Tol biopolymer transport system component